MAQAAAVSLNDLPNEIIIKILSELPLLDQYGPKLRLVCKRWNELMKTKTYKNSAYTDFILADAIQAESIPANCAEKACSDMLTKYTTNLTTRIIFDVKNVAVITKCLRERLRVLHININSEIDQLAARLATKEFVQDTIELVLTMTLEEFPYLVNLNVNLQLLNCQYIRTVNCNLSTTSLTKLFLLPVLQILEINDKRKFRFVKRLRRIAKFVRKRNFPKFVEGRQFKLLFFAKPFLLTIKGGQFEPNNQFNKFNQKWLK